MEKHVGLNPAWFEPGPDGVSPFDGVMQKEWRTTSIPKGISAAFRALIAQDAAQEPPALQVGDVVRLERYEDGRDGLAFYNSEIYLIGTEHTISEFDGDDAAYVAGTYWPVSACTLVRRAGEPSPVDKDAEIARLTAEVERWNDYWVIASTQRDEANAEVERLKSECSEQQRYVLDLESSIERKETRIKVLEVANDSLTQYSSNLTAERDALRARIDAGVRVYSFGEDAMTWMQFQGGTDTHTALLIDARPIAEADERKGERRQTQFIGHVSKSTGERIYPRDGEGYQPASRTFPVNRRRTAGTIADRKESS